MNQWITAKEIHTATQLRLQKVGSNQYTQFAGDELDNMLNSAYMTYISKIAFGDVVPVPDNTGQPKVPLGTSKDIALLAPLIVKNCKLPLYKPNPNRLNPDGYIEEPDAVYATLPENYLWFLNSRSETKYISQNPCTTYGKLTLTAAQDTSLTEYVAVVPFLTPITSLCTGGNIPLTIQFMGMRTPDGTYKNITVFDYNWFTKATGYDPILTIKEDNDKWFLVQLVLQFLNRFNTVQELVDINWTSAPPPTYNGLDSWIEYSNNDGKFKVYWERYKDRYHPNCFIFVTNQRIEISRQGTPAATNPTTYYADDVYNDATATGLPNPFGIQVKLTAGTAEFNDQFRQISYRREILDAKDTTEPLSPDFANAAIPNAVTTARNVPNRLVTLNRLYYTIQSPWGEPVNTSPIVTLAQNYIFVYPSANFCIKSLYIDYIRKPRPISLRWNIGCELNMKAVDDIIDMTVANILRAISSPRAIADAQYLQTKP
jgi:hypothetical protein